MIFLLSKFAGVLLRPSTLLLLCCVVGLALSWRGRSRLGRGLLLAGVGGFVLVLLLPIDQWALLPLEDRFPQIANPPAHVDGIIVLGGAVEPDITADRGIPSLNGNAERMTEGVTLARRYPNAKLVFTGGRGAVISGSLMEADVARMLFTDLGVAPDRLVMERRSRTTWENAVFTKELVHPKPGETWILVTSADHVARGVGAFRAVGWDVIGWPVGYKSGHSLLLWLPSSLGGSLSQLDEAVHEWVGLVAYWAMGRSSALFPAP
ncbi:MAG: YdcF family protein [Alphaproteobacteria bacterium]|nr:YdcF family protein [Alphaproteobacteria bacterium]